MARQTEADVQPVYVALEGFVDRVLRKRDSLFTPGHPVWGEPTFGDLYHRFVEQPDVGAGSFLEKFEKQLDGAPAATCQLAGELVYLHLVTGNTTGGQRKRELINTVLGWSPTPLSVPPELDAALDKGLAAEGIAFKTYRPFLIQYLMEFVRRWWSLGDAERAKALADPWAFKEVAFAQIVPGSHSQAEILLHMVHPDAFESIMSRDHKKQIALALATDEERKVDDVDRRLAAIRARLVPEHGAEFSFYVPAVEATWAAQKKPEPADVPPVTDTTGFWKISPGEGAFLWDDCLNGGYICIGWDDFGDLSGIGRPGFKAVQKSVLAKHAGEKFWTPRATEQLWRFAREVKKGDRIVANHGTKKVLGIGVVTGDYHFVAGTERGHRLPVKWYDTGLRRVEKPNWLQTMLPLKRDAFEAIVAAPAQDGVAPKVTVDPLADDPLADLVLRRKNVVLYGPPGTGKTRASLLLAERWRTANGTDAVLQVTFHPTFTYEDFIEGFRPDAHGRFELRKGIFVEACERAAEAPDRPFLLVIDELNRGDAARLFGELITLIEADKRHAGVSRRLPYSQRDFWVPPNLHLVGTMNTADRSISLLDIAIRRRFAFVEYRPDPQAIVDSLVHHSAVEGVPLGSLMEGINRRLREVGVDRDRAVGHSHFLIPVAEADPLDVLRDRVRYDVVPLVEEYCYADRSLLRRVFGDLVAEDGLVDDDVLDDDAGFADAIRAIAGGGPTA